MILGLIGVGTVGGTLQRWLEKNTHHELRLYDPWKELHDDLAGCDAIFISIPVLATELGQDLTSLKSAVAMAKKHTPHVFIRSTVLPGTADSLDCISCPEFLTARRADEDMATLPVLVGMGPANIAEKIFYKKQIVMVENVEAEMAKFAHNCFGAMKVTYFNMIYQMCKTMKANYEATMVGASITGFIEPEHTLVPGPDGKLGFGGVCFPGNVEALRQFARRLGMRNEAKFLSDIQTMNREYRGE